MKRGTKRTGIIGGKKEQGEQGNRKAEGTGQQENIGNR